MERRLHDTLWGGKRFVRRYVWLRIALGAVGVGVSYVVSIDLLMHGWAKIYAWMTGFEYASSGGGHYVLVNLPFASVHLYRNGAIQLTMICTGLPWVLGVFPLLVRRFRPVAVLVAFAWAFVFASLANMLRLRLGYLAILCDLPWSIAHDVPTRLVGMVVMTIGVWVCLRNARHEGLRQAATAPEHLGTDLSSADRGALNPRDSVAFRWIRAISRLGLAVVLSTLVFAESYVRISADRRLPGRKPPLAAAEPKSVGGVVPRGPINSLGMVLVEVPAGTFLMGTPQNELSDQTNCECLQYPVTFGVPFLIGAYEVTQRQYRTVMGNDPSNFTGDDLPVESVSWFEAVEFCRRLSEREQAHYRLPSEAEWEYACRAGTNSRFHFGDSISAELANYAAQISYPWAQKGAFRESSSPVGSYPANSWGLCDMHGNVGEWCSDAFACKCAQASQDTTLQAATARVRVYRGGGWYSDPKYCRAAFRDRFPPETRRSWLGLRVVREAQ